MNRPAGPSSPLSMSNNDAPFAPRYGLPGRGFSSPTTPIDPQASSPHDIPLRARPSPPSSQHHSSGTDMSRPSAASSMTRPPSSASSVGRSSDGRMGFGGPMKPGQNRDSGRSYLRPEGEEILQNHYGVLRNYLASSLRDAQGNIKPNRARDKLLRLSATQFMELSTDVFDELIRREDDRTQRVLNVPPFLPPRNNFHPKRNQARQKLSTLPVERFKQLATDVFYELERRIPRIANGDHSRSMSMSSNASRGMRGPSSAGFRGPGIPFGAGPPSDDSLGRPVQKIPQSNTIVPNKGTMIEDDDDEDDDEDAFGLDKVMTGLSARGESTGSVQDKEKIEAQESEITELRHRIESLEGQIMDSGDVHGQMEDLRGQLQQKDDELARLRPNLDESQQKHRHLQDELDQKLADAQQLQSNLQRELNQLRDSKLQDEQEIRNLRLRLDEQDSSTDNMDQHVQVSHLQTQLAQQEKVIDDVRAEAMTYLQEMRDLSRQNDRAVEQEDELASQVSRLEIEVREWRRRYASAKAQNKSLRASTLGLGLSSGFATEALFQQEGILSGHGLVKDTDMTHFQVAIDELLNVARSTDTNRMLDGVKNVVVSVQAITSAIGTDGYPTPSHSPSSPSNNHDQPESVARLRARVTGTANSLITATKQHAAASGLSPVVLLDAAASNLTASVVALIKAVGIRASTESELDHDHAIDMNAYYDERTSETQPQSKNTRGPVSPAILSAPATPLLLDPASAKDAPSTPLNFGFGRSDSNKKPTSNGGWFGGWGRKVSDEESASSAYSTDAGPHKADVDDYEGYRSNQELHT